MTGRSFHSSPSDDALPSDDNTSIWLVGDSGALALQDDRMAQVGVTSQLQRYAIELERDRKNYDGAIARLESLDTALQWKVDMARLYILAGHNADARQYLDVANIRLRELRPIAARTEMQQKIDALMRTLR